MISFSDTLAGNNGDIAAPPGYKVLNRIGVSNPLEIRDEPLTGSLPGIYAACISVDRFRG
jgi:hypothetical protein